MQTFWMDFPWIAGLVGFVIFFAYYEARAFRHPERQNTFSRACASLGAAWPFSIFLIGFAVGVVAAHLFWPWGANPLGTGLG